MPKSFAQGAKNKKIFRFFSKKPWSSKFFFWTLEMKFLQPRRKPFNGKRKNSLKAQTWSKEERFSQKCFLPKRSITHVKCSFENPAEIFSDRTPKKLHWTSARDQNVLLFQKSFSSSNFSYEHVECSFDNPTEIIFTSSPKVLAPSAKQF